MRQWRSSGLNKVANRAAMLLGAIGLILLASWLQDEGDSASGQAEIRDYEQAREVFWGSVYADGGRTLYCDEPFAPDDRFGINVEHVFPMAWVTNALKCGDRRQCRASSDFFNRIEADLHNLYPARAEVNDARGAMKFGEIAGETPWQPGCDFEIDESRRMVEPRPAARGEVARAMFYMQDQYDDLEIFRKQGELLKQWHRQDPVSAHERQRNDIIERLQGTRNPYIDHPERADEIEF